MSEKPKNKLDGMWLEILNEDETKGAIITPSGAIFFDTDKNGKPNVSANSGTRIISIDADFTTKFGSDLGD